jgi:hypothetical protein
MVITWPGIGGATGGVVRSTQAGPFRPVIVDPGTICVPSTLRPTSAAVKFAVGSQTFIGSGEVIAVLTDRTLEFSTRNVSPTAIGPLVGMFRLRTQVAVIDVTNVRGAIPGPEITRFTQPVADVQSATVSCGDPAGSATLAVIVRAAPLWYTALEKSWIVNVGDTKSPGPAGNVAWLKMHATRR